MEEEGLKNDQAMAEAGGIEGMHCGGCDLDSAPAQPTCPNCGRDDALDRRVLPSTGRLYSFTIVHVPPAGLEEASPYALGIVALEGGARITARIETKTLEKLLIGMPLALARRSGGVCFFKPA